MANSVDADQTKSCLIMVQDLLPFHHILDIHSVVNWTCSIFSVSLERELMCPNI